MKQKKSTKKFGRKNEAEVNLEKKALRPNGATGLVFWMSNAGFWEIDDKKICVQTSFSRIPLRICLQIKVNLENL